jgi:hypothetical protein
VPQRPIGEAICQKSAGLRELSKLHPQPPLNAGSGGSFLLRAQSNTGENASLRAGVGRRQVPRQHGGYALSVLLERRRRAKRAAAAGKAATRPCLGEPLPLPASSDNAWA